MMHEPTVARFTKDHPATDAEVVARVLAGETNLFEVLMRRHNELIYRVLRARLSDEALIEDVMQRAYLNSFRSLKGFEGRAKFSTWLVKIALRESYKDKAPLRVVPDPDRPADRIDREHPEHPERHLFRAEVTAALQRATDALPDALRLVFLLRDVQQLSTQETADTLELDPGAVRVRLHRARGRLRKLLSSEFDEALPGVFAFYAPRCNRVVAGAWRLIRADD